MKNVYDIRYEKKLNFILPNDNKNIITYDQRVCVIVYLYYLETISDYYKYIETASLSADVYVISSVREVLEKIQNYTDNNNLKHVYLVNNQNRGRDISGLLITAKEFISKYEYVCYLHDKISHKEGLENETKLWAFNLWDNLLGGQGYVNSIVSLFSEKNIGVLAPPDPIGEHFSNWYGFGWQGAFDTTKSIAQKLNLNCDLDISKPPITLGTAIWFKYSALKKLFEYPWKIEDFDDMKLTDKSYFSYGIERIFAYVAQDAGFDTGQIMSINYAQIQDIELKHNMVKTFGIINQYFPFVTLNDLKKIELSVNSMIEAISGYDRVYLYGAGKLGKFCLSALKENGIEPDSFIVSNVDVNNSLGYKSVEDITFNNNEIIIITVMNEKDIEDIKETLRKRGLNNYYIFWS